MINFKQRPLRALLGATTIAASLPLTAFAQEVTAVGNGGSAVWTYTPEAAEEPPVMVRVEKCEIDDALATDGILTWVDDDNSAAGVWFSTDPVTLSFTQEGAEELVLSTNMQLENLDGGDPLAISSIEGLRIEPTSTSGANAESFGPWLKTASTHRPEDGTVLAKSITTSGNVLKNGEGSGTFTLSADRIRVNRTGYNPDTNRDRYRFTITMSCNFPTGQS